VARLGDYVRIRTGKLDANASSEKGQYPFFTCAIEPLRIDSYSYDCECVLVAGNGDLNVKYYNGKFDAYQRTYIIESLDKSVLTVPYLYCFLDKYVETLRQQSIGGVIKYIKLGNLTEADIPILPVEEQEEVVTKINKANNLISTRKEQLAKLDQLVKSRFIEMFGHPVTNEKCWEQGPLSACVESIDNGKSFVCDSEARQGNWPAILKLSAATYGIYRPEENKALIDENQFVEDAAVHAGDLLFTRKNTPELVGMCAYVYETPCGLMMRRIYVIEGEYLRDHPDSGYLTEILPLTQFPDYIDYLPTGAIVRKIGVMGYLPKPDENVTRFITMSREEYRTFVENTIELVLEKISVLVEE